MRPDIKKDVFHLNWAPESVPADDASILMQSHMLNYIGWWWTKHIHIPIPITFLSLACWGDKAQNPVCALNCYGGYRWHMFSCSNYFYFYARVDDKRTYCFNRHHPSTFWLCSFYWEHIICLRLFCIHIWIFPSLLFMKVNIN